MTRDYITRHEISSVAAPEENNRHGHANENDKALDPELRQLLRIVRRGIPAKYGPRCHDDGLRPDNRLCRYERERGNSVDHAAQPHLQLVHGVNIAHSQRRKHGQIHDPYPAAKIATVYRNEQFEEGCAHYGRLTCVMRNFRGNASRQMLAKRKKQRGPEQQPGNHTKKSLRRRVNQENCSGKPPNKASNQQRDQDAKRNAQLLRISVAARGSSNPQSQRVRCISRNRRNTREKKRGKRHEASAPGDGIDAASERSGEEKKNGGLQVQAEFVSRFQLYPPVARRYQLAELGSPAVVNLVSHDFLAVGRNLCGKFHRLAVNLFERVRVLDNVPARPTIEVLDNADFDGRGLVIANFDFKGLVNPPAVEVGTVFGARSLPRHVERVAGIKTNRFVFGRVVNVVLSGEFELAIIVAPVEANPPLRKRHAQMILGAVLELLHNPDFGIGEGSVAFLLADALRGPILIILVELEAVVHINRFRLDARCADHLDLLGFAVMQSRGVLERIQMIFVEGLFRHGWAISN